MFEGFHHLSKSRYNQLDEVDAMRGDLRAVVHDYGYPVVKACISVGLNDAAQIRQLIKEIWMGERQSGQKTGAVNAADVLLSKQILSMNALVSFLAENSLVIVPVTPTRPMLDASLEEVSGYNIKCTKEEKHRRRLSAAIMASPYHPKAK